MVANKGLLDEYVWSLYSTISPHCCSANKPTRFGFRYVSRSLGFSMGWLYWYSLGILVPYEITAAGLVIEYWSPPVNIAVWMTIMLVVVRSSPC